MHSSHQIKLLNAGFTIYFGENNPKSGPVIKAKTYDNHNWHIIERGFKSIAELKRRLVEIDKRKEWIDLYDTKNNVK